MADGRNVGVAIWGAGGMAIGHLRAFLAHPDAEVLAVGSRREASCRRYTFGSEIDHFLGCITCGERSHIDPEDAVHPRDRLCHRAVRTGTALRAPAAGVRRFRVIGDGFVEVLSHPGPLASPVGRVAA